MPVHASSWLSGNWGTAGKVARADNLPLTSIQCLGEEYMDLYPDSPICLHGVMLNSLNSGTVFMYQVAGIVLTFISGCEELCYVKWVYQPVLSELVIRYYHTCELARWILQQGDVSLVTHHQAVPPAGVHWELSQNRSFQFLTAPALSADESRVSFWNSLAFWRRTQLYLNERHQYAQDLTEMRTEQISFLCVVWAG
jgi:hypothetical protein